MQTWPALRNLLDAIALAATAMSASSNTITGAWPPSSIVARFMCRPAMAASCLPTAVEPVKEILRMTGCGMRYDEISAGSPYTRFTVPAGTPASAKARMSSAGEPGVSLGCLDDDRAARGERRRELAHDLVDGKVPRRERRHRAHRLLHHELVNAFAARGNDAAIGTPRFFGEPVDRVGAVEDLGLRFGERLALLHRHQAGDEIEPLAQQRRRLAHSLRALVRGDLLPGLEALVDGLERAIEVGALGIGELADDGAAGRVDDGLGAAGEGGTPLAVDVELDVGVGAGVHVDLG